jgi:hypothetical protein
MPQEVADQDLREPNKTLWVVQSLEECMWKNYLHFGIERRINDGTMNTMILNGGKGNSSGSCDNN